MRQTSEIRHPDRLKRMVSLLERDAANPTGVQFDLGTWAAPADGGDHAGAAAWKTELQAVPVDCGTRACAVGLAAISGEFKAEGLSYRYVGGYGAFQLVPTFPNPAHPDAALKNFEAAAELFGIDYGAAGFLFDPAYYETLPEGAKGELEVAERINQFIADGSYDDDPDEFLGRGYDEDLDGEDDEEDEERDSMGNRLDGGPDDEA